MPGMVSFSFAGVLEVGGWADRAVVNCSEEYGSCQESVEDCEIWDSEVWS